MVSLLYFFVMVRNMCSDAFIFIFTVIVDIVLFESTLRYIGSLIKELVTHITDKYFDYKKHVEGSHDDEE